MEHYQAALVKNNTTKPEPEKLDRFDPRKFNDFEKNFDNYLEQIENAKGVPISYIIRKDRSRPADLNTESTMVRKIWNAPLQGPAFSIDNETVFTKLKELVLGTDGETWIKGAKGGREAMDLMRQHYDGKEAGKNNRDLARSKLQSIHYKNETLFPFETYCTNIQKWYKVLDDYGEPEHESVKVDLFYTKINSQNAKIMTAVEIGRDQHSQTLDSAMQYMIGMINRLYPNRAENRRTTRKVSEYTSTGRNSRGQNQGRGRGGRGGRSGRGDQSKRYRGDLSKYIKGKVTFVPDKIWNQCNAAQKEKITSSEARKKAIAQKSKGISSASSTTISLSKENENRLVSGIIQASKENESQDSKQPNPKKRSGALLNGSAVSVASSVTYDKTGKKSKF